MPNVNPSFESIPGFFESEDADAFESYVQTEWNAWQELSADHRAYCAYARDGINAVTSYAAHAGNVHRLMITRAIAPVSTIPDAQPSAKVHSGPTQARTYTGFRAMVREIFQTVYVAYSCLRLQLATVREVKDDTSRNGW
jgi:hypothetical protein